MAKGTLRILLIEDDLVAADMIKRMLSQSRNPEFAAKHVTTLAAGLEQLRTAAFDLVLVDLRLPDIQGVETALQVQEASASTPIVVLTVPDDEERASECLLMGIQDYLLKGEITSYALVHAIRSAIQRKRIDLEGERRNDTLTARVAQLEQTNLELEAFTRMVSHDLRQPLNTISASCQAIGMLCEDRCDEKFREYLEIVYNSVFFMSDFLEAVLKFTRVSHRELRRERIDLSELAQIIAAETRLTDPVRRVRFDIAEGLVADADPEAMRSVLENFIGNAWKYTGAQDEAVIQLGAADVDGNPAYFIKDNGSGFDMSDADKLFAPLQRLPGAEKTRGFRIGLATVERIIRRHGGQVWGEGEPGRGATFYFTLPQAQGDEFQEKLE